jgi:hypothetical protein
MLIFRATATFTDAEEHPAPGGPGGPGDFEVPGRDFRGLVGARPPRAPPAHADPNLESIVMEVRRALSSATR